MSSRILANIILLITGAALVILMIYGVVGLAELWAETKTVSLSTAHRIGITVLGIVVAVLLTASFSRLLFQRQRLHLNKLQIEAISAPLSVLYPINKLLALSEPAEYADFERCLVECCENLNAPLQPTKWKLKKIAGLESIINTGHPRYRNHFRLAAARLAARYSWLPQPSEPLRMIAHTNDLGMLGQILVHCKRNEHELAAIAVLRYEHQCAQSPLAHRQTTFAVKEFNPRLRKSHGSLSQGRKMAEYFRDYVKQRATV